MSILSVQQLYVGYFGRAGDPAGLNYWLGQELATSVTFAVEATQFSPQLETLSLYPSLAAPAILAQNATAQANLMDSIYLNLFGHKVSGLDAAGLAYWQSQLAASVNIGQIVAQVISGALGADLTAINSKAGAAQAYTNAITAAASPAVTWSAAADTSQSRAMLATVKDAATQAAAGGLIAAAIVQDQKGSTGTPGVTLTLASPNVPALYSPSQTNTLFLTTANNDTIRALKAGDLASNVTIDGGGGVDTLNAAVGPAAPTINPVLTSVELVNLDPNGASTFDANGDVGLQQVSLAGGILSGVGGAFTTTIINLSQSVSVGMANAATAASSLAVTFTGVAASGNSATLVLNGNAGGFFDTNLVSGNGINTYNIQSTGAANKVSIGSGDTQLTTVNISGGSVLALTNTNGAVTTISGSGATGALNILAGAVAGKLSMTGGSGADTLDASAVAKSSTLNGGAGNDTLIFNGAVAASVQTGGGGNDTIDTQAGGAGMSFISAADATTVATLAADVDVVTDYTAGSTMIDLQGTGGAGYTIFALTGTQLTTAASKSDLLQAAKFVAGLMTTKQVAAFAFGSDEYIYQDKTGGGAFSAGDGLMKLSGAAGTFRNSDLTLA